MPLETSLSPDGHFLAYSLDTQQQCWRVCAAPLIETGHAPSLQTPYIDEIQQVYASGVVWDMAGQGFFYNRFWAWPGFHALYYHRLMTDQATDRLIYQRPDQPHDFYLPHPTADGRYLVISVLRQNDWRNGLLVQELTQSTTPPIPLMPHFIARYDFIMNQGTHFWLQTQEAAHPQGRVIALDLADPAEWQEIVPEKAWPLQTVIPLAEQGLALLYLKSACSYVEIVTPNGDHVADLPLPNHGTVDDVTLVDDDITYNYTDFITPPTEYRMRFTANLTPFPPDVGGIKGGNGAKSPPDVGGTKGGRFETQQVWYPAHDGVPISIFLTYKRTHNPTLAPTGQQPIYLYVYGGFGESLTPHFSPDIMAWLELGGVYAVANLRGGGEYGLAWHQAAVGRRKQTTFDDCLAAAEWLIKQNYTCPARLALGGMSNGGLTAAACLTQRPDLFGAVIIESGLMDMLHFDQLGVGADWLSEYGSPHRPADKAVLQAYSPLHQIKKNTAYPATLIITHEQDPRVGEAHSFNFAAALQAAQAGDAPILLQVIPGHGHGGDNAEIADIKLRFLVQQLGVEYKNTLTPVPSPVGEGGYFAPSPFGRGLG